MAGNEFTKDEDPKSEEDKSEETDDTNVEDAAAADKDESTKDDKKLEKSKKRKGPPPTAAAAPARSGKRDRKAASTFVPADTFKKDARVTVLEGRGIKLADVNVISVIIEDASANSVELASAFKLLFSARGKFTGAAMKGYLLDFNGYLPVFGDDVPEEKRSKLEEDAEAKVSKKAYKFKTTEIKMLCDFFIVDRSGVTTKEELIDRLLDFLGEINEGLLKTAASKKPSKKATPKKKHKKKKDKKSIKAKEEEEETGSEGDGEEGNDDVEKEEPATDDGTTSKPNDKVLRRWVKAYIACFNMDKATIKHAIETASDKFGMDLSDKKQKIKQILTEEM